ncbi:MAG: DoxX family protein [Hyphomicrobium sp.]
MNAIASVLGRVLLSAIFIQAGLSKISGYEGAAGYMQSAGVPGQLLPAVIALELGGGLMVLLGFYSRWAAFALAAFCIAAAVLFHGNFGEQAQAILFMKNLAIAGGFLMLFAGGPGRYAVNDH